MGKKSSIRQNYIYNLLYQFLAVLVPLVTTPYVTRVLGPERLGEYAYTSAMVSYFGIVAVLGTVTYGQREVAASQTDEKERSRIFYEILCLRILMTALVVIAYVIFLDRADEYRILYLIQLLTVGSWAADISWFFQGMENFRVLVIRNSAVKLAGAFLIFGFIRRQEDIGLYTAILSGTALAGNLLMWPFLRKTVVWVPLKTLRPFRHLRGSLELFLAVVGLQVYTVLDQTMIGWMSSKADVGYYSQAMKIINLGSSVLASLMAVLMPRITVVLKTGNLETARFYYEKAVSFGVLINFPMTMGLMMMADRLALVFLGEAFLDSTPLLRILSLIFITQGIGQIAGTLLVAMKRHRRYTGAILLGSAVNFSCNLLLIGFFGARGAAIASIIAEICVELFMLKSIRPEFSGGIIRRAFLRYLPPVAGMCLTVFLARQAPLSGVMSLLFPSIAGAAVYILILVARKDPLVLEIAH